VVSNALAQEWLSEFLIGIVGPLQKMFKATEAIGKVDWSSQMLSLNH
jgi:hypothetical protein